MVERRDDIQTQWRWSPPTPGYARFGGSGLYRPDVAMLSGSIPIMVVEVDASTEGKAAVGALTMATLAFLERRQVAEMPSLYALWFQVVTGSEAEREKYEARLRLARDLLAATQLRIGEGHVVSVPVYLGNRVLIESEVGDLDAWRSARPSLIAGFSSV